MMLTRSRSVISTSAHWSIIYVAPARLHSARMFLGTYQTLSSALQSPMEYVFSVDHEGARFLDVHNPFADEHPRLVLYEAIR